MLTGVYLLVVIYLIIGWAKLKRNKITTTNFTTKVTVVIAARNEAQRIHLTIEDILAQSYPKHLTEIIIVDDHSTDSTAEIISSYAGKGVKLLQLNEAEPLNSYKKKAIAMAIGMATGELIVATDADCRMNNQWLASIAGYYEAEQPVMISAPVAYFEDKSLFERLQRLEFTYLIGIGAAFIGNGRATTCNGANFAYRKDVFYEVGGFKGIDDLASGDDELLMQKVAVKYPDSIGFLKLKDAVVYTHAKATLKEFLQQRRRWASKSTKYKDKKFVAFGVCIWLFNLSVVLNMLLSFYDVYFFKLFLLQIILKVVFEIAFLIPINLFFKQVSIVWLMFILSPIHCIYMVYVGLLGNAKKYNWKGRTVK